jgi:small-conductance mechanosensitive channel
MLDITGMFAIGGITDPYLIAVIVFVAVFAVLYVFKEILIGKLKKLASKTKFGTDNVVIEVIEDIGWPFYFFLALYAAIQFIVIPEVFQKTSYYVVLILIIYYITKVLTIVVDHIAHSRAGIKEKDGKTHEAYVIFIFAKIAKVILWVIAFIFLLSNLGYNVSSLVAGLGIGGIAIALALQNVLSDVFSALTIYLDKPFEIGDFVIIGQGDMGTIKKIGVKSTRIATIDGQELVVSNKELTNIRINNYKKMKKRRVVFAVGVTYDTSSAKLKKIPQIIKQIIKKQKMAEFNRSHFKEYAPYSLNIETIYYMKDPDYTLMRDTHQKILLDIKKAFEKEKIEFAFPTQSVILEK